MTLMWSPEQIDERLAKFRYLGAFPWERWMINRYRHLRGQPPLRIREVRRELLELP